MLTNRVHSPQKATASVSNEYLWCLHCWWTEHMVKVKRENRTTSTKAVKLTANAHTYVRRRATWARGHCVGVFLATHLCITYHHITVLTGMSSTWARGRGQTLDPRTFCFSGLAWHLACSRPNRQLLWSTKWPCVIPLLVSKPAPDSWLVNSTCRPEAKQDLCCQSGGSHVEPPWQSYSFGIAEKTWGGAGAEVGGGGAAGILYADIQHRIMITFRVNRKKVTRQNRNATSQILVGWTFSAL